MAKVANAHFALNNPAGASSSSGFAKQKQESKDEEITTFAIEEEEQSSHPLWMNLLITQTSICDSIGLL